MQNPQPKQGEPNINRPQTDPSLSPLHQQQRAMTAYLRDPDNVQAPQGLNPRRLGVYSELVFNNVDSQLSGGFPVIHSILSEAKWTALVRAFLRDYRAQTPYFTQLSAEFVHFLSERTPEADEPAFLVELAHYERIEIDLYMMDEDSESSHLPSGNLLDTILKLTDLAVPLAYHFPVQNISTEFQPETPPETPTFLLLFQDAEQEVRFFELQPLAYHLVVKLAENTYASGHELLASISATLPDSQQSMIQTQGLALLEQLNAMHVLREIRHD